MSSSGIIKTVAAVIAGVAVVAWLQLNVFDKTHASTEDPSSALSMLSKADDGSDGVLKLMASELNQKCPMKIDDNTTLESGEVLPGNGFAYHYKLLNVEASQVDTASLRKNMDPGILENLKTNVAFQYFREKKVTMVFNFHDKNGVMLISLAYAAGEY